MKIRAGFVSNSSSTSFLIISKKDLTEKDFFELMGIAPNSPIADLFSQLYRDVLQSSEKIDFKKITSAHVPERLLTNQPEHLSARMLEKIREAKDQGLKAYYGWLDSETSPVQTFFCTDSFEVENEKIYFNGLECVW